MFSNIAQQKVDTFHYEEGHMETVIAEQIHNLVKLGQLLQDLAIVDHKVCAKLIG